MSAPDKLLDERCVVCTEMDRELFDAMSRWQNELGQDKTKQDDHVRRGGFCAQHTWSYEAIGSPYGICLAYPAMLLEYAKRLRSLACGTSSPKALAKEVKKLLPESSACAACERVAETETASLNKVLSQISVNANSGVLCMPHFFDILDAGIGLNFAETLIQTMSQDIEGLAGAMQGFASNFAARRRHEMTRDEKEAYKRGLSRLVGERNISAPWTLV